MIMKSLLSSQLSPDEFESLAKDILRLGRNPVFEKIVSRPGENGLNDEKGKRKKVLYALAHQDVSRRQIVKRSLRNAISNEAGWMIMLDLFLHQDNAQGVSTKGASIASGLPSSTALRVIDRLEQAGFVTSDCPKDDRRRRMLSLTPDGHTVVTRTLLALENLLDPLDGSNRHSG